MYSTGFSLLLCGIPAATAISFMLMSERTANLSGAEALVVGACMLAATSVLGATLLLGARLITKHQRDTNGETTNPPAEPMR
jgi:hypothetical protein